MKLKTQENIRKIELIAILGSVIVAKGQNIEFMNELYNFVENNNISSYDLEMIYQAIEGIYTVDLLTSFRTQKITSDYKELKELYDKVISNTGTLISELDFKDPISIFAFYVHMYRSGYLSHNKDFKYSTNMKDFSSLTGLDVVRGRGVCRSVAGMLNDIYKGVNMESQCMMVKTSGDAIRELEHLSTLEVEKTENSRKFVKFVSSLTKIISMPNHMITAVSSNGKSYILDPMNDGVMYNGGKNNLVLVNNPEYSMKNFPVLTHFYNLLGMFKDDLGIYKSCEYVDKEEYRKIYLETVKTCKDNTDLLEKFYEENQEIYSEIYSKSENKSGLIKRMIPIIPQKRK